MVEGPLIEALDEYLTDPRAHINERQLAQLAKDLIQLAGDQPIVIEYLNRKASETLEEDSPWG